MSVKGEILSSAAAWSATPLDPYDMLLGQWMRSDPESIEDVLSAKSKRSATPPKQILYGLPFDAAVLGRKGTHQGPAAIRAAARTLKLPFGLDARHRSAVDLGDLHLPNDPAQRDDILTAHRLSEEFALQNFYLAEQKKNKSARVIALGGDHSLAYPCIKPYLQHYGDQLAVINLDAHLDIRNVVADYAPNSGTGFGRLIDAGMSSYTVVGLRPFQNSAVYLVKADCHEVQMISAETVFEKGAIAVAKNILKKFPPRIRCIYLSVDVDVADASVAPGCSAPSAGGILAHQVFQLVRTICADARTQACGIFELAPNLEEANNDRTARLAAGCLAEMIFSGIM